MYWTHHFAHHETLKRARLWLQELGFSPDRIEVHSDGPPRLALTANPVELAEVEALVHAVERTDPQGWPSFWDVARQEHGPHPAGDEPAIDKSEPDSEGAIGWHPPD